MDFRMLCSRFHRETCLETQVKNENFLYVNEIILTEQSVGIDGIFCLPVKVNREKQTICVDDLIEVRFTSSCKLLKCNISILS